jgi:hypothetical protein
VNLGGSRQSVAQHRPHPKPELDERVDVGKLAAAALLWEASQSVSVRTLPVPARPRDQHRLGAEPMTGDLYSVADLLPEVALAVMKYDIGLTIRCSGEAAGSAGVTAGSAGVTAGSAADSEMTLYSVLPE